MFCSYHQLRVDHGKRFARGKVYIIWSGRILELCKRGLTKYNDVFKEYFSFYLKELEFRFNNKTKNIFKHITQNIETYVPDLL